MFDNIGGKIKSLAQVVCWIAIICSVISGIVIMATDEDLVFLGFVVMAIGSLVSWVSSFTLYGFGQLVENSDIISKTLAPNFKKDLNDNKTIKEISDVELEKTVKSSYSNWVDSIKDLSNEELQERIDSEDWQFEYKALCKKELENRK